MRSIVAAAMLCLLGIAAHAEWKPEYANSSPEIRAWYSNAKITDRARHRFPWNNCCDHADVVKAKFGVRKTDHGDEWSYRMTDADEWRVIPEDIIHWGESAPGGQPTLFVYQGRETCFYPPGESNL